MALKEKQVAGIVINISSQTPTTTVSLFSDNDVKTPKPSASSNLSELYLAGNSLPNTPEDAKRKKQPLKSKG